MLMSQFTIHGEGDALALSWWSDWRLASGHGRADVGRHRSRLLISAALFEVSRRMALKLSRPASLDDFQRHWPTDDDHVQVDFMRERALRGGATRTGDAHWRRLTEERAGGVAASLLTISGWLQGATSQAVEVSTQPRKIWPS